MKDLKKLELNDEMMEDVAGGYGPSCVPTLDQLNRMNWLRTQPCFKKQGGGFHEPWIKDGRVCCQICGET